MEKALEVLTDMHNIYKSDPRIKQALEEVKEAMKPKTCEGCIDEIISSNRCEFCIRTHPQDFYVAKDNA